MPCSQRNLRYRMSPHGMWRTIVFCGCCIRIRIISKTLSVRSVCFVQIKTNTQSQTCVCICIYTYSCSHWTYSAVFTHIFINESLTLTWSTVALYMCAYIQECSRHFDGIYLQYISVLRNVDDSYIRCTTNHSRSAISLRSSFLR